MTAPALPSPDTLAAAVNAWADAWRALYLVEHTADSSAAAQDAFDRAECDLLELSDFGRSVLENGGARG